MILAMVEPPVPTTTAVAPELRAATAARPAHALEARAARGDRDALAALLREHAGAVFQLCHHLNGPQDGRDAAQAALERIVRQIAHFDPARGAFRTWAFQVARNVCRDRLRRRGLERAAFLADGEPATAAAPAGAPDPERVALARIEAADLAVALETLPENMRSAIVLFHVHEASYEEIAHVLDVPIGTVMTWLHRGRKRLRAAIESREDR